MVKIDTRRYFHICDVQMQLTTMVQWPVLTNRMIRNRLQAGTVQGGGGGASW